jgi:inhibitor of the pro-sigma K processing machinery
MDFQLIIFAALGILILLVLLKILAVPMRIAIKLIWNGIIGAVTLLIFNWIGGYFGLAIEIEPINALIVGIFGVPGIILLLILQNL